MFSNFLVLKILKPLQQLHFHRKFAKRRKNFDYFDNLKLLHFVNYYHRKFLSHRSFEDVGDGEVGRGVLDSAEMTRVGVVCSLGRHPVG